MDPAADCNDKHTEWTTVADAAKMETESLACSKEHFAQANKSLLAVRPPVLLPVSDGFSAFGDAALNGAADINSLNIDPCTKLLLWNMKWIQTNVPDPPDLTEDDMNDCFHKWSEWTLTSPSNLHLSVCKALLKHLQKPKDDNEDDDNEEPVQCGKDVMSTVFLLLKLAVHNTHVFKHLETTGTCFWRKKWATPRSISLTSWRLIATCAEILDPNLSCKQLRNVRHS